MNASLKKIAGAAIAEALKKAGDELVKWIDQEKPDPAE